MLEKILSALSFIGSLISCFGVSVASGLGFAIWVAAVWPSVPVGIIIAVAAIVSGFTAWNMTEMFLPDNIEKLSYEQLSKALGYSNS